MAINSGAINSSFIAGAPAVSGTVSRSLKQITAPDIWFPDDPAWELVHSYDAIDVTGSILDDLTSNGHDATLTNVDIINDYGFLEQLTSKSDVPSTFEPDTAVGAVVCMFRHEPIAGLRANNIFLRSILEPSAKSHLSVVYGGSDWPQGEGVYIEVNVSNITGSFGFPDTVRLTGALTAGQWYALVVQSDGASWTGYLDGVAQTPVVVNGVNSGRWFASLPPEGFESATFGALSYVNRVGGNDNAAYDAFFSVDDYRISNRVLTAQEISDLGDVNLPRPVDDVFPGSIADYDHPDCFAAYPFDADTVVGGAYDDATGNGYDSLPRPGVIVESGKYEEAAAFDGTDLVRLPGALPDDLIGYSRGSLSFWVKPKTATSGSASHIVFTINGEPGVGILQTLRGTLSARRLVLSYTDSSVTASKQTTAQMAIDVYTHVVVVADGGDWLVYFDGVLQTTDLLSPLFPYRWFHSFDVTRSFSIGGFVLQESEFVSTFLGVDQFQVFKRPLTQAQVTTMFTTVPPASLRLDAVSRTIQQVVSAIETDVVARTIQQTVNVVETGALTIVVEQDVFSLGAVSRALSQRVSTTITAQDAVKWEAIVTVDGVEQSLLTGAVSVTGGEGEQILASFQIKPDAGVVTVADWVAKSVTIDYADQTQFARLFTGIIDEVEYDATENLLTFLCITNRKDLINAKTRGQLDVEIGGFWSKHVFDEDADPFEYANDRVSTVLAAYETTPYNQFILIPFAAKSVADVTYSEPDIIDGTVVPTFVSRDQLVNNWVLNFDYRYDRLRHRERTYTWNLLTKTLTEGVFAGFNNWAEYLRNPVTLLPRDAVETAIESNGWTPKAPATYTNLPPAGYFDGWGWTPKQSTTFTDEQGRQIRQFKDVSAVFTTSADFTLAKRFAQQITEQYAVTMTAPQSVAQYGSIDEGTSRGIRVDFDISDWEDFTAYKTPTGSLTANGDWAIDKDDDVLEGGRSSFDNAVQAAQSIIKREILDSHRQNYAEFEVCLDPLVDLTKTIHVDTTRVQAKGKVYEFEHVMIIDVGDPTATTSVKLAISKATGSQSDDAITVPTPPTVTDATFSPPVKTLGTHFGNHSDSPTYQDWWSGFISNYQFQDVISASHNQYPSKFTVDSEKIGDEDRKERKVPTPSTVNIEIPDELLTITAP